MKKIRVEEAAGTVLAHDITRILPGKFKGVAFKKGHIVREADIPELIALGKKQLYVLNLSAASLHEDAAALRIAAAVCGPGLRWTEPSEGKSTILAETDGLLKIDVPALGRINRLGPLILSTLKTRTPCRKDQPVAATRIIPLVIPAEKIERLEGIATAAGPVLRLLPYRPLRVGAVVTGSEVYNGLVTDGFDAWVGSKISAFGSAVVRKILTPDDAGKIAAAIAELKALECDLIVATGGLSVDPDDVTRRGVRKAGARLIAYGSPILPGAMFLYALLGETPILGLPACVYYHKATVFDLMLPRVLAGESISRSEIAAMGHGGLCLNCPECRFPACPFGK
jgi:hypothetical protein